jgi:hypothetical protein
MRWKPTSFDHRGPTTVALCLVVGGLLAAAPGCDGEGGGTPCERAYQARCKRACECQPGAQCSFAPGGWQRDGGFTVIPASVIESEEACLSITKMVKCAGGGDPDVDYEACASAAAAAPCEDFEAEGTQYTGMAPVRECHSP